MINKNIIKDIFEITSKSGDFTELFFEDNKHLQLSMTSGAVDKVINGTDHGVGIRILNNTKSVYGFTNNLSKDNLLSLATNLSKSLHESNNEYKLNEPSIIKSIHDIKIWPDTVALEDKKKVMKIASDAAYDYSELITQVAVLYKENVQEVHIINSDGLSSKDKRVNVRLAIDSYATKYKNTTQGMDRTIGGQYGFEIFDVFDVKKHAIEASRLAIRLLDAVDSPSEKMPVIIENGFGGVIFHEACGHGLEATSVSKGLSVFTDKLGKRVANDCVTAIDDGTIKNGWGSLNIDDEGNKSSKNVLIENGILKSFMVDKLGGRRMNKPATGSTRRQSYKYAPTSRMTNTYIANGTSSLEDMLKDIKYGLYAKKLGGGSVNTTTGDFNFACIESYIIRDGKICELVKGATLIGNGPDILSKITMVGDNLKRDRGMCGSVSGSITADVGQPRLLVSSILVGGTSK